MNIQISGNLAGPTVIFVAGWPDTCDVFRDNIMAALKEDYRIVGITLPGFDAEAPFITSYKDYMRRLTQGAAQESGADAKMPNKAVATLLRITRWCSPLAWLSRTDSTVHSAASSNTYSKNNTATNRHAQTSAGLRLTPLAAAAMREEGGMLYHTPFFGHNFTDLVTLLEIAIDTAMEMHNYCPRAILASSLMEGGGTSTTTTTVQGVPVHQLPPFYPKPVLVAHDWGCKLAFDLLQARPDFFARFVALDIGMFWAASGPGRGVPRPLLTSQQPQQQQQQQEQSNKVNEGVRESKPPSFMREVLGIITYQLFIIVCFLALPIRLARWLFEFFVAIAGRPVYRHNPDIRLDAVSESFNRRLYRQRFYSQHYYHGGHDSATRGGGVGKNSNTRSTADNKRGTASVTQEEMTWTRGAVLDDTATHDAGVDLSSAPMAGWSILLVPFIKQSDSGKTNTKASPCPIHGTSQTLPAASPRSTSWWRFWPFFSSTSSSLSVQGTQDSAASNIVWHGYAKAGRRRPGPMLHADPYHALQDSTVFCPYDVRPAHQGDEGRAYNDEYGDGGDAVGDDRDGLVATSSTQAGGCTCGQSSSHDNDSAIDRAVADTGSVRFAKREVYYRSFFFPPREDKTGARHRDGDNNSGTNGRTSASRAQSSSTTSMPQRRRTAVQTVHNIFAKSTNEAGQRETNAMSSTSAAASPVRVDPRTSWIYVRFWVRTILWLLFAPRPSASSSVEQKATCGPTMAMDDAAQMTEEQQLAMADSAQASATTIPIAHHYDVADATTHSAAARWAGGSAAVAVAAPRTREEAVWQSWLDNEPPHPTALGNNVHNTTSLPSSSSSSCDAWFSLSGWRRYCTTLPLRSQDAMPVPILFMYGGAKRLQFHSLAWCDYILHTKRAEDGISDVVEVKGGGHWFYAEEAHRAAVAARVRDFIAAEAMSPSLTEEVSHVDTNMAAAQM